MNPIDQSFLNPPNNIFYIKKIIKDRKYLLVEHISGEYKKTICKKVDNDNLQVNDVVKIHGTYHPSGNIIKADNILTIGNLSPIEKGINLRNLNDYVTNAKCKEKKKKRKSNLFHRPLYFFGLNKSWAEIGDEVRNRKELFLSALYDLENAGVKGEVQMLAATDVFVEKAQKILTKRAGLLLVLGSIVSLIALMILLIIGNHLLEMNVFQDLMDRRVPEHLKELNGLSFALILFKKISLGAFFFGAVIFLVYIARALFHEGFTLYSKRHALRFGRLYVYLKGGKVDFKDLEEAFQWNKEFSTAFKDIRPDLMSKTMINTIPEIIKPLAETFKSYYERSEKSNKKS